ncbi:MAG TPA: hypothetical protein VFN67_39745 [Polyangiales bacterium]|nr:hypothetical protein [Polyangiales bacterium]
MPTWIDAIASRSGPLHTAAAEFAVVHGLETDPPRGVGGLCALSKLISDARADLVDAEHTQAADDVEAEERQFVAGAGAYLGLLLLDHLPSSAHVAHGGEHRLRLSAHGFFDPFAAVADALNANDAPRALLAAIQRAEAEAAGSGPTARVGSALRARLAQMAHVRVLDHFDERMWLDVEGTRVELDLARVINTTRGESDALLTHAVDRLCSSLVREASPLLRWEGAQPLLFPRLLGKSFVETLPDARDLHLKQLASDVWQALVLRFKDRARFVRRAEVDSWNGAQPDQHALNNLAQASEAARFFQHFTRHGTIVVAESRDGLDAARLLLPGLHSVLAPVLGREFIVSTPHRDTLLACPARPEALIAELRSRTDAAVRGAPHAISQRLWLVKGPGQLEAYA